MEAYTGWNACLLPDGLMPRITTSSKYLTQKINCELHTLLLLLDRRCQVWDTTDYYLVGNM